ncbi:MAG TPA: four helix bundle protein [Chthoniobacteraceae bacterium]|nr:four helix bundle protein [Chthoniobacteraceae bacterium]
MKKENAQRSTPNTQRSTDGVAQHSRFENDPKYDLEERLLDFAERIIHLSDSLPATRSGNHIAGQLLRSGTSPLPNHGEAQAAESAEDFIHKLKVCLKELRETRRWLRLCRRAFFKKNPTKVDPLIAESVELIRIFASSIKTASSKLKSPRNSRRTAAQ